MSDPSQQEIPPKETSVSASERTCAKNKRSSKNFPGSLRTYLCPALLVIYLVVAALLAIWTVYRAWPDNERLIRRHDMMVRPRLVAEVSAEGIARLGKARQALERSRVLGSLAITRLDEVAIQEGISYAGTLNTTKGPVPLRGLSGNSKELTLRNVTNCIESLEDTIRFVRTNYAAAAKPPAPSSPVVDLMDDIRSLLPDCLTSWCKSDSCPDSYSSLSPQDESVIRQRAEKLREAVKPNWTGSSILDLFILVAACGALGASGQGIQSTAMFVGGQRFLARWSLYYLSRPLVGGGVAITIYFMMRAGLMTTTARNSVDETIVLGACAVGILSGLFVGEAIEKLHSIAGALFKSNDSSDALNSPLPHLISATVESNQDGAGTIRCAISIKAINLHGDSVVFLNGLSLSKESVIITGTSLLNFSAPENLLGRNVTILVMNPGKDGGLSNTLEIEIPAGKHNAQSPAPVGEQRVNDYSI